MALEIKHAVVAIRSVNMDCKHERCPLGTITVILTSFVDTLAVFSEISDVFRISALFGLKPKKALFQIKVAERTLERHIMKIVAAVALLHIYFALLHPTICYLESCLTKAARRQTMALTLSRRELESIRIGNDIEVQVSKIQGSQVRLSITAPKNIKIMRKEVTTTSRNLRGLLNWLRNRWR